MIGLPTGTRVWLAAGLTDMRRGFDGLAARYDKAAKRYDVVPIDAKAWSR